MNALQVLTWAVLALAPAIANAATGPRPSFCQGIALMSGQLQQRLQQGDALEHAIEGVLDDTEAPPEREGPRQFLAGMADLLAELDVQPMAAQSFILLSCLQADMFGDEAAQSAYRNRLPFYMEGTRQCSKNHGDAQGLQQCMIKAFIVPGTDQ